MFFELYAVNNFLLIFKTQKMKNKKLRLQDFKERQVLSREEMKNVGGGLLLAHACNTASDCPPYVATCGGQIVAPPTASCRNGGCVYSWGC